MSLVSFCSCLCPIRWSQVLSRYWKYSWSSADSIRKRQSFALPALCVEKPRRTCEFLWHRARLSLCHNIVMVFSVGHADTLAWLDVKASAGTVMANWNHKSLQNSRSAFSLQIKCRIYGRVVKENIFPNAWEPKLETNQVGNPRDH